MCPLSTKHPLTPRPHTYYHLGMPIPRASHSLRRTLAIAARDRSGRHLDSPEWAQADAHEPETREERREEHGAGDDELDDDSDTLKLERVELHDKQFLLADVFAPTALNKFGVGFGD